jgi:pimeloyl-ACP methyl ester carboxylesterase
VTQLITVVILPGMDGTGIELADFVAALAPELDAIVVTYPNDRPMDYAGHQAVARARLPVDRQFVLLGESFSGPIAISIAASAPQGLIGLVLCATFARNPRPGLAWLRPLVRFLPTRVPASVPCWLLLGRFSTPRLRHAIARVLAELAPDAFRARLTSIIDVDVAAELVKVRVPVLYLRATRDRLVPPRVFEEISRTNQLAQSADVESPHLLLQTAPAVAARSVKNFVNEAMARSASATKPAPSGFDQPPG